MKEADPIPVKAKTTNGRDVILNLTLVQYLERRGADVIRVYFEGRHVDAVDAEGIFDSWCRERR